MGLYVRRVNFLLVVFRFANEEKKINEIAFLFLPFGFVHITAVD